MAGSKSDLRWPVDSSSLWDNECENYLEVGVWLLGLLNDFTGVLIWSILWPTYIQCDWQKPSVERNKATNPSFTSAAHVSPVDSLKAMKRFPVLSGN